MLRRLRRAAGAGPGGAMEGGGNSKGTGLGGLFGAGGVGYSHADLAGVPREYRRAGATGGARVAGQGRARGVAAAPVSQINMARYGRARPLRGHGGSGRGLCRPAGSRGTALPLPAVGEGKEPPPPPGPWRRLVRGVASIPSVPLLSRFLKTCVRVSACFNQLCNLTVEFSGGLPPF